MNACNIEFMLRQNQELERYSASMLEDKLRLQEQADSLSQRLEAVLHDKFERKSFDADTPIDKTLAYLESVIQVRLARLVAVSTTCISLPADQAAYIKGIFLLEISSMISEVLCLFHCCGFAVLHSCLMCLQLQLEVSSLQPVLMTFQAYSWHYCVLALAYLMPMSTDNCALSSRLHVHCKKHCLSCIPSCHWRMYATDPLCKVHPYWWVCVVEQCLSTVPSHV